MIRITEDFRILEGKSPVYIYGAKNIAKRLYPILRDKGYDIKGFLVSVPSNNESFLFGLPVMHAMEIDDKENAYIVVGVNPQYKREIVNSLLNMGFKKIVMLHDNYVAIIRDQLGQNVIDFFYDVDYLPFYSDEVESNHCVICNLEDPQKFKARIPSDWWFGPFQQIDKSILKGHRLAAKFENSWGEFSEVPYVPSIGRSDGELKKMCNFYSIRSHVDRQINLSDIPDYMIEIQAGADLTKNKLCKIKDNVGDNISNRNRDFSECSAFYWIWKNQDPKEYTGVCHYRRHLAASATSLVAEMKKGVDIINTIPTIMYPSIGAFFDTNFFYNKDRELLLEGIAKLFPEYMATEYRLSKDVIYLANNIFVMKTELFNKMCEFVFGVILYMDDYYRANGFVREDRYAGYVFEYLYSLFILHHAKELKITYTNMKFLQ